MMKFSNVKEALDMLVIFNSKDSSPDYIVDENGNKTPITVEEVKSMNMEAIAGLVELLGMQFHSASKKADLQNESTLNSKELLTPLNKIPDKAAKVNQLMKWERESDSITERKKLNSLMKDYLEA